MWAGPKKGDKIGDRIREEAELDRERFSGLVRAVYDLSSNGGSFKTLNVHILQYSSIS